MKSIFVTGTDTSVGKTFICAHLLKYLREKGIAAGYQKWVSTGDAGIPADLAYCMKFAGLKLDPTFLDDYTPFRFRFPASPHLAAETEGRTVQPEIIQDKFFKLAQRFEVLIIEGAGGLLVPLRRDILLADLLVQIGLPVLLVARSGLGTLNHTLLSLEALRNRKIPVLGVVFSDETDHEDETLVNDNMKTIKEIGDTTVFGRMPWIQENIQSEAEISFRPIGDAILNALRRDP